MMNGCGKWNCDFQFDSDDGYCTVVGCKFHYENRDSNGDIIKPEKIVIEKTYDPPKPDDTQSKSPSAIDDFDAIRANLERIKRERGG